LMQAKAKDNNKQRSWNFLWAKGAADVNLKLIVYSL
jgi:hypothetical protein